MSVSTFGQQVRPRAPPNQSQIQKILDDNAQLIQTIQDYQLKGKQQESIQYQQVLHRNLVYLATLADGQGGQNIQQMLPVSVPYLLLQYKFIKN